MLAAVDAVVEKLISKWLALFTVLNIYFKTYGFNTKNKKNYSCIGAVYTHV